MAIATTKPHVDAVFASWPGKAAAKKGDWRPKKNTLATTSTCSTVAAIVKRGGATVGGAANGWAGDIGEYSIGPAHLKGR